MINEHATKTPNIRSVETKLEVVVIPVSDVDRSKRFYQGLGWRLDADFSHGSDWRVVQLTPPGSPCSIIFGKGITTADPGSVQGLFLIVSDIAEARAELIRHDVDVSELFHFDGGLDVTGTYGRLAGADPEGNSYRSWASFRDPDGNGWLLQEIKTPPREGTSTGFYAGFVGRPSCARVRRKKRRVLSERETATRRVDPAASRDERGLLPDRDCLDR
jgi:catechol 2,3-dioxygenase-like lactoylglutathione lyase family enzyme